MTEVVIVRTEKLIYDLEIIFCSLTNFIRSLKLNKNVVSDERNAPKILVNGGAGEYVV
jgi:hypothetical protein